MSLQKINGGTAVLICKVPPTFKPQRCWDVPTEILSGYLHAKNLSMPTALGFARVHNIEQVDTLVRIHRPIESWAIVMRHLKPEWKKHPLRIASPKSTEKLDRSEADEDQLSIYANEDRLRIRDSEFLSEDEQIRQGEILDRITDLLEEINDFYVRLDYYTKENRARKAKPIPQAEPAGVGQEGGAP